MVLRVAYSWFVLVGLYMSVYCYCSCFFFQAEDGIRDLVRSRGLGDVYKRQVHDLPERDHRRALLQAPRLPVPGWDCECAPDTSLSLIHI